jgi:hypothetical protein
LLRRYHYTAFNYYPVNHPSELSLKNENISLFCQGKPEYLKKISVGLSLELTSSQDVRHWGLHRKPSTAYEQCNAFHARIDLAVADAPACEQNFSSLRAHIFVLRKKTLWIKSSTYCRMTRQVSNDKILLLMVTRRIEFLSSTKAKKSSVPNLRKVGEKNSGKLVYFLKWIISKCHLDFAHFIKVLGQLSLCKKLPKELMSFNDRYFFVLHLVDYVWWLQTDFLTFVLDEKSGNLLALKRLLTEILRGFSKSHAIMPWFFIFLQTHVVAQYSFASEILNLGSGTMFTEKFFEEPCNYFFLRWDRHSPSFLDYFAIDTL